MQSNQNAEGMAALFLIAIAVLIFQIMFAVVLAVGIIVGVVVTLLCLIAWNKPLPLFGEVVTPLEARCFVLGGIASACGVMFVFALAGEIGLPFPLTDRFYAVMALIGYLYGGFGSTELAEQIRSARAAQELQSRQEILPPLAPPPPPPYVPPFDYADWNDEDEFRR